MSLMNLFCVSACFTCLSWSWFIHRTNVTLIHLLEKVQLLRHHSRSTKIYPINIIHRRPSCYLLLYSFHESFLILQLLSNSILFNLVGCLLSHLKSLKLINVITIEQNLHVSFISWRNGTECAIRIRFIGVLWCFAFMILRQVAWWFSELISSFKKSLMHSIWSFDWRLLFLSFFDARLFLAAMAGLTMIHFRWWGFG